MSEVLSSGENKEAITSSFVKILLKVSLKLVKIETSSKKIAIGVLTADCVPILIYDKNKKIVSAIHAGWKGIYKGIINKVINFLLNSGSKSKDLIGIIGPCISQKNYEIKKDFINKFYKKDKMLLHSRMF